MIKKWACSYIVAIVIGCAIGWNLDGCPEPPQDFTVHQSLVVDSPGYKRTYLDVIIHKKGTDISEMFEAVKMYNDKLNGESDELRIKLYDRKEDLREGRCRAEKTFKK